MAVRKDYSKGKIYKLVNNINDEIYVGSCTSSLGKRKYVHKSPNSNCTGVKDMYDNIGWDQLDIVLIENYPCENSDELRRRERYWYDELKPSLNRVKPYAYVEDKRAVKLKYFYANKDKQKKYYEDNRQRVLDRCKEYRKKNDAKIKEREHEKATCECGAVVNRKVLPRHRRTVKHIHNFIWC